jgi:hypothetical protein
MNDQHEHVHPALIEGSWRVETVGAPYPDHVMIFHPDGTFLIHNPTGVQEDPQDSHGGTHDSIGVGAWELDGHYILATFFELNAFVDNRQPAPDTTVTMKLKLNSRNEFAGPAIDSAGRHVTLFGTRVVVDRELAATLIVQ